MKMTRYLTMSPFPSPDVACILKLAKLAELSWFVAQQWTAEIREYSLGFEVPREDCLGCDFVPFPLDVGIPRDCHAFMQISLDSVGPVFRIFWVKSRFPSVLG